MNTLPPRSHSGQTNNRISCCKNIIYLGTWPFPHHPLRVVIVHYTRMRNANTDPPTLSQPNKAEVTDTTADAVSETSEPGDSVFGIKTSHRGWDCLG